MGIDNIILPLKVIQKLYATGIVNLDRKESPEKKFLFKGKNLQRVLILVDTSGELKAEEQNLLENVMKACQLSMDDVALVNLREQEMSVPEIISALNSKKALFFGIPHGAIQLPIEDVDHKLLSSTGCTIIKTLPLSSLEKDPGKKRALWSTLKLLFNL